MKSPETETNTERTVLKISETLLLFFFKWPCFFLGFVVFIIDKENVTVRNETLPKPSHLETAIWHSNQNGVISWLEFSLLLFFFKWPCFFLGFVVFIIDKENVTVRNETLPKPSHLETAIWHSNQNGVISWLEFSTFLQCEPAFERLKQIPFFLSANG